MIKRALLSVYDKKGIVEFAAGLADIGIIIISTGGTAALLRKSGIKVTEVSEVTKFPEMMGGRVKTLHPKIHGGLLCKREDPSHVKDAKMHDIEMIDLIAVNLYPFEETVKQRIAEEDTVEMIDIGGPSMIRSAAKNFHDVAVLTDSEDYKQVLALLKTEKEIPLAKRKELAAKAFRKTASYDAAIAQYFSKEAFPEKIVLSFSKRQGMRYGENPYQEAAFYVSDTLVEPCIANAEQLHGKELSYNNIMDADAALEIVKEFSDPCTAVIKHANPSGVALDQNISGALAKAYNADPLSAFGCIIAMNRMCDLECAQFLKDKFVEVIIAEDFKEDARMLLEKKKNIRLLRVKGIKECYDRGCRHEKFTGKKVIGGLLIQTRNFPIISADTVNIIHNMKPTPDEVTALTEEAKKGKLSKLLCVTKKKPTKEQLKDLLFAMKVCKHVKSNSVLYAKDLVTVGIGAGQMSRVDAAMIATTKSAGRAKGAVMASDAFFPFRDGIDEAAKAGVIAIIQPGGSVRDKEVIDAANEHGIAMVFTGVRLFLH